MRLSPALSVALLAASLAFTPAAGADSPITFVTLVQGFDQARQAEALITSIRAFAGPYRDAPIYVLVDNPDHVPTADLRGPGVTVLALEMDEAARILPFAGKAYAAAQVERLLAGRTGTLAWLDPEVVVLAPPRLLELDDRFAAALRPVQLVNAVGQTPDAPVDVYWQGIFRATGADPSAVPAVETSVDGARVRFYVNCQVIAWRLGRDIGPRWARAVSALARDRAYLADHAAVPLRRFFLHQAVLSGVLLAATTESERRWLPLDHGYPLNLHERIPEPRRARSLDGIPCLIVDTLWQQRGDWTPPVSASDPVRAFLERSWARTYEVVPGLLRQEGQSNAYLLRTDAGDVVIDPGGSPEKDGALRRLHGDRPLLAVLLTHGHADHREGIANWTGGRDVPVVAQRRHAELLAEQDGIAPLLARRTAIIAGRPVPSPSAEPSRTPVEATVLFDERHAMDLGGTRVEMIHAPSETPDTAIVWVPSLRAAFVADMFFSSFPNLSTPRGGRTRSAIEYARALDVALGLQPDLLLPGHEEPVFGRDAVRRRLETYRDAVLWVDEAVLRGIRAGKDVHTLMAEITLPERLAMPERFGRVSWSVRGLYEASAGWFDGRPESLYALSPTAAAAELAALAGAGPVAERARALLAGGDAARALVLTEAALAAEPGHAGALEVRLAALRALLAASRNYFERAFLRHAIQQAEAAAGTAGRTPPAR